MDDDIRSGHLVPAEPVDGHGVAAGTRSEFGRFASQHGLREGLLLDRGSVDDVQRRGFARALGAEAVGNSPAAFTAFVKEESARWGKIIRDRGIKPE